jgi:hopanoid biosynthesis associated protein HpnK
MKIYAILNADDFGLSPGINRGIIEAYRDGILTSASLMAVGDAFEQAVTLAEKHPGLSLGIHLTLVEGIPILPPEKIPSLLMPDGCFPQSLGTFLLKWLTGQIRMQEVQQEFAAQIEKALDHRIRVDKLDSHMHLHLLPGIFQAVLAVARRYGIGAVRLPRENVVGRVNKQRVMGIWRRASLASLSLFRTHQMAKAGFFHPARYAGIGESGRLTEEDLLRIFRALRPGVTEIMVHPGYHDSVLDAWPQSRRYKREQELLALTSPRVKELVERQKIELVGYRQVLRSK